MSSSSCFNERLLLLLLLLLLSMDIKWNTTHYQKANFVDVSCPSHSNQVNVWIYWIKLYVCVCAWVIWGRFCFHNDDYLSHVCAEVPSNRQKGITILMHALFYVCLVFVLNEWKKGKNTWNVISFLILLCDASTRRMFIRKHTHVSKWITSFLFMTKDFA
jgi:hypothetical protein